MKETLGQSLPNVYTFNHHKITWIIRWSHPIHWSSKSCPQNQDLPWYTNAFHQWNSIYTIYINRFISHEFVLLYQGLLCCLFPLIAVGTSINVDKKYNCKFPKEADILVRWSISANCLTTYGDHPWWGPISHGFPCSRINTHEHFRFPEERVTDKALIRAWPFIHVHLPEVLPRS